MLGLQKTLPIVFETARGYGRAKIAQNGPFFYALVWLSFPIWGLLSTTLIYRENQVLRDYAIVAGSATGLIFLMLFGSSELLDGERQRGTLGSLFMAPVSRFAWLGGFQLFSLLEMIVSVSASLLVAATLFEAKLSIDVPALILTMVLFLGALWGISMILGAIGVVLRNANQISNLIFPFIIVLAGTMYPVDRMPDWLRLPAKCLPFSYGMEALVGSVSKGQSISELDSALWPLTGFAIVLPIAGVIVFSTLEKVSRRNGTLEFMPEDFRPDSNPRESTRDERLPSRQRWRVV